MIIERCMAALVLAMALGGCGGGSGGGVTSALIQTLPVGDDIKEAVQQIVDKDENEIDVSSIVDERTSYRDGLDRLDDTLDSVEGQVMDAVDFGEGFSFGVSPAPWATSARGVAGAGALLGRVMDDAGAMGGARFGDGFAALAQETKAGVARVDLSPSSSLSLIAGTSLAGQERGDDLAAFDYARSMNDGLALGLRAGMVREGGDGAGAGMTRFVEGRFAKRVMRGVALVGEVGLGLTDPGASTGTIGFDGALTSVETRLGLALGDVGRAGDRLTLSAGVPRYIAGGTAILQGAEETRVSLKGRVPLEARFDYALPLGAGLAVGIDGTVRRDTRAKTHGDLALGMRLAF